MINKNKFLITGGTGSFGKSMLKYLLKNNASEIRILSRDEKKQENLRLEINDKRVKFIIGDVRDINSIERNFENIDYVFHAAALKQVPSCEFYPLEAIKTNVLGTENVIKCAIMNQVKTMVLLSTDKAVYPVNAMGMTKGLAEKLMLANSKNNEKKLTKLCITRYGNVMGSRGSVIPLFIEQIKKNKTLTVTDYNMTRFIMSLDESIDLVIKAFNEGESGDIFVKKAPAVTIKVLVSALLEIFKSNSKVNIIGTRHGEKLYETLVSREELARSKETKDYFCIKADTRTINYETYFTKGKKALSSIEDYNSHNTKRLSVNEVKKILLKIDFVKKEII
tara:strand:- start:11670 stop:12677 length:1008 start_codon:yes stop_codon:yes gene_type:complete